MFCSCGHNRLEHISGDFLSDNAVQKCQMPNCTCSKYHGRRDNDDSYLYKFLLRAAAFIAIGIGMGAILFFAVDSIVTAYDVSPLKNSPETFLVYENGTRVDTNTPPVDYKLNLAEGIKMLVGMVLFVGMYLISALFLSSSYDYDKRKAIHSK